MDIIDSICQKGTWIINLEESLLLRRKRLGLDSPDLLEDFFAEKIYKMIDSKIAFNRLGEYFNQIKFGDAYSTLKHYFQVDLDLDIMFVYDNAQYERKPLMTFDVYLSTEKHLHLFMREEEFYLVFNFDNSSDNLPKGYTYVEELAPNVTFSF